MAFVFEALDHLGVRTERSVSEGSKRKKKSLGLTEVFKGEMVEVDLREASNVPGSMNGPFLRLADYHSGWLFEYKSGEKLMVRVKTEVGLWAFKVVNQLGIALRRHPIDRSSDDPKVVRDIIFPAGCNVIVDMKAVNSMGVEFYRVQATGGWVFRSRGKHTMMTPVPIEKALEAEGKVGEQGGGLSLNGVRQRASSLGLEEVQHNPTSCVVAFKKHSGAGCDLGPVRINVYYTTGTIGTALCHPRQGSTQLFRRDCNLDDFFSVASNPRWHSGRGYQQCKKEIKGKIDDEIPSLRCSLHAMERDLIELQAAYNSTAKHLQEINLKEIRQAEEKEREKEKEEKRRKKEEAEKKRGNLFDMKVHYSNDIHLHNPTTIAMGGSYCTFWNESNGYYYTKGMTDRLHKLLHSRAPSHPQPTYVSMGSMNRFYIKFTNGKEEWRTHNHELNEILLYNDIHYLAFGSGDGTYVVGYSNDNRSKTSWGGALPNRLRVLLEGGARFHKVTLGPNGEWFAAYQSGKVVIGGYSSDLQRSLGQRKRNGEYVREIIFGEAGCFIMRYSNYNGPF